MANTLKVTLVKSPIGAVPKHKKTVAAMGLTKMHKTVEMPDNAATRGMIQQVQHLVKVEPSKIDQWIKCQARVHCAGHYMDDYYAFFPTVDEAKLMGHEIVRR